jgi:hypothetical protein
LEEKIKGNFLRRCNPLNTILEQPTISSGPMRCKLLYQRETEGKTGEGTRVYNPLRTRWEMKRKHRR